MLTMLLFLLAGRPDLFSPHGEKAVVLLFIRSDCPVSNRYAPDLQRLYERYSSRGVDFRLVYPEPGLTAAAMEKHSQEYGYTIPALLDSGHEYVNRARARITPEAAVFVHGELVYHGRIDDRYVETRRKDRAPCIMTWRKSWLPWQRERRFNLMRRRPSAARLDI